MLGNIITGTAVLRAIEKPEFNRLKMYFRVGFPPKNHSVLAELAKCTLAG